MKKRNFLSAIIAIALMAGFSSCKDDDEDDLYDMTTDLGLYINEVASQPNPDRIELYNSSDNAIDLGGFMLKDNSEKDSYIFPAGTIVPAKGFLLLAQDDTGETSFMFGLSSGGDEVRLFDASGNLTDRVTIPAMVDGESYARSVDGAGEWQKVNTPSLGTSNSGSTPVTPPEPPVIDPTVDYTKLQLSEISGIGADPEKYIEIYNSGDVAVSLEGVALYYSSESVPASYSLTWTGKASDEIAAKSYFVIQGAKTVYPGMSKGLSAKNADVYLQMRNPAGEAIDTYAKLPELAGDLANKVHQKVSGEWYYTAAGTKGAANTLGSGAVKFGNE